MPLPDQAATALDRLSRRCEFAGPDDYVFANRFGRRLDPSALRRRFERARDATGLEPLRFHDLRHTYGSLLVAGGIDLVSVKAAVGHSRITTTERYPPRPPGWRVGRALHARPGRGESSRRCRMTEWTRRVRDPNGREVVFDAGSHLHLAEGLRAWLLDHVDTILGTVKSPDHHTHDPLPGRERFYGADFPIPGRWLRVVVDFNEEPGWVVTALDQETDPRLRQR